MAQAMSIFKDTVGMVIFTILVFNGPELIVKWSPIIEGIIEWLG